jgi:mannose-1-phosphate guanylyltransferase
MPKQFVKLFDDTSLFQLTVKRNNKLFQKQLIVSNVEQYFLAHDQLEELQERSGTYILEPIGRNTAPAIALSCLSLPKDEVVLVTPSDHLIKEEQAYHEVLQKAVLFAQEDNLVTFGITPTAPETGFGYIEADQFDVKAFHEKPNESKAKEYIESGNYYWNSGMFCFKAGLFLKELQTYAPDIYEQSRLAFERATKDGMIRISHEDMANIREESIDYAVMEKSDRVKVVPATIGWSDVGSFDALAEELPCDAYHNLVLSDKRVELIDIENSIVVDTQDALLIAQRGSSQKVKEVVQKLKLEDSELPHVHVTGYRPWGSYTILDEREGYKIKRIEVQPHKRLSLQSHHYRNEHWVVISGEATITLNDEVFTLKANESTYIKAGDKHRLANETDKPLTIIEAQVGSYTGEDDIIRYDDDFKRS